MGSEDIQILIAEFNRQFSTLRNEINTSIEKMADRLLILGEANISCAKDIEATRAWSEEKNKDLKKDIHGVGESLRTAQQEILKITEEKIKNGNLTTRLVIAGSYVTAFGALIMLFISKKLGG